jgi:hypothetical protein
MLSAIGQLQCHHALEARVHPSHPLNPNRNSAGLPPD